MKKRLVSILLAVVMIAGLCSLSANAKGAATLTAEEYKNMQKTTDFICCEYYVKWHPITGDIYEACIELYPDQYQPPEYDNDYHCGDVQVTKAQLMEAAKILWPYVAEKTLDEWKISPIWGNHAGDVITLRYPGGWGGGSYNKNTDPGTFLGYKKNTDGSYSFYHEILPWEDLDPSDAEYNEVIKLLDQAEYGQTVEYKGKIYEYWGGCPVYQGEPIIRVFNYKPVDGKAEYISDEWGLELPETFDALPAVKGDVDGDCVVTSDDAIYLLYFTLLPDLYPVDGDVDFDGDGAVTSDDAIYLLYYTLLPDLYPLK